MPWKTPGFPGVLVILAVMLPSCAVFKPVPEVIQSPKTRQQLAALEKWRMDGRVGVRSPDNSWQAGLIWHHERDFDRITISGPFGQGALKFTVGEKFVQVNSHDGAVQESEDPEQLMKAMTGIAVPVMALRYWLLGLPYPLVESDSEYDGSGRLLKLNQLGWVARYQDYQTVQQWSVPKKLSLVNQETRLKLVVDEWQFTDADD